MKQKIQCWITKLVGQFITLFLLTYGMFYFSYKYYTPQISGGDYHSYYYKMILSPLDFSVAEAPFIYRQFQAIITFLIYKSGLFYQNEIFYINEGFDVKVFFSALFSNYLALLLTALLVGQTVERLIGKQSIFLSIAAGLLCFLTFYTQGLVLTGMVEGWSWFLIILGFCGYIHKEHTLLIISLLIAIFQRETIPIIFGTLAFIDYLFNTQSNTDKRYYLTVFGLALGTFLLYISVRLFFIPVSGHDYQLESTGILQNIMSFKLTKTWLFQSVFAQNLYILFLLISIGFYWNNRTFLNFREWIVKSYILQITGVLLVLYIVGIMTGIGNNAGRVCSILSPIIAALIISKSSEWNIVDTIRKGNE